MTAAARPARAIPILPTLAGLFALAALALPLGDGAPALGYSDPRVLASVFAVLAGAAALARLPAGPAVLVGLAVSAGAAIVVLGAVAAAGPAVGGAIWSLLIAAWLLAWSSVDRLTSIRPAGAAAARLLGLAVPVLFGVWILVLWEALVRGLGVPAVLLPPPSAIGARLVSEIPTLAADFRQTFLKAVLIGWAMGCLSGFLVALVVDRVPFLRRGLLPVGNLVSALPIVGVAPIMVMWFGFDWPSKAAVVVIMTFFPMLVNTVAGLEAAGRMERDLMRTYAAGHGQELLKLRLPMAMPFVFNALKINSTLALIGAIVAEFFGTPTVGMGFRISTEVGRMAIDMVWAEIAVAALAGSLFYGALALVERVVTFWHPSFRR
jgi:NitT/TauT family transport system permease protein